MKLAYKSILLGIFILSLIPLKAFNRSLFFRASSFWDEPRLAKPYLSTLDIQLAGGSNHRGRNRCHKKTNILSIYGPENICALNAASPDNPLILPHNPSSICFQAVADVFEADFNFYQNFDCGFFTQFHLPALLVQLYPSGFLENNCCNHKASKHYKPVWQNSFKPINAFLKKFDLSLCPMHESGLSDSTIFVGWTKSFDNTDCLDFVDVTAKTGLLLPTGRKASIRSVFDIPFGYNGFWAFPLSGDVSVGYFDWLTIGLHADSLFFLNKRKCIPMKAEHQTGTGLIRLGRGEADVHHGTVWRVGTYIKADHLFNGLSVLLAFSYEQQNRSTISPCDPKKFNPHFVNRDERLKKWDRSIVHLVVEYDFASEGCNCGPRIGFFYDGQLIGKRVWDISILGGYLGIDMNWCY